MITTPASRRALSRPLVDFGGPDGGDERCSSTALEDARDRHRSHERDEKRVQPGTCANLARDEHLADDADDLAGSHGEGQKARGRSHPTKLGYAAMRR